jgi:hypothetical protein
MQSARSRVLDTVKAGDVIFGIGEGGQEKLLFVYRTNESRIFARLVTSQTKYEFGRDGKSRRTWDGSSCSIASTAALSAEDYEVAIGLDRKMQRAKELTDLRLSKAEINLLLTVHDFFKARPLPES